MVDQGTAHDWLREACGEMLDEDIAPRLQDLGLDPDDAYDVAALIGRSTKRTIELTLAEVNADLIQRGIHDQTVPAQLRHLQFRVEDSETEPDTDRP